MIKFNILKRLFKRAPMNFYNYVDGTTVIKSINNTFQGYKFDKIIDGDHISSIWSSIKQYKRITTIGVFLAFIILLYGVIFPYYTFLSKLRWYFSALPLLIAIFVIYQTILRICTVHFEKWLKKHFGEFERTVYNPTDFIDEKYYKLFKLELAKAFGLILVLLMCFCIGSPSKITLNLINNQKYDQAIKLATVGSKIFPIAPTWYSLRGYSKFQIKDYDGAIKDYDKAYRLGPDEYSVMNFDNKIFIKYYTKQYDSAIKDFDSEIANAQTDEDRDSFLWDKAQFLYNIKQYEEALKIYNDLLVKSNEDRVFLLQNRLYFERAEVYKKLGKEELAEQDLQNANNLNIEESFKNPIPEPTLLLDEM